MTFSELPVVHNGRIASLQRWRVSALAASLLCLVAFASCSTDKGDTTATGGHAGVSSGAGGDEFAGQSPTAGEGGTVTAGAGAGTGAGASGETGSSGESGAGGSSAGSGGENGIDDPAPFAEEPGETKSCAEAPDTNLTVFEYTDIANTSKTFSGVVTGADGPGTYYVSSGKQAIRGTVPTESNGSFQVTLPLFCGEQTLKLVWTNAGCVVAAVVRVIRVECQSEGIRLTLSWDNLGRDFELHLIKQGGRINDNATDCTWTSCLGSGPDWGTANDTSDNPHKDVDNTGSYGPENIFYADPEDGTYTVMVEHWGGGTPEADGQVTFNVAGKTTVASIDNLASHWVWQVGTIEWPSGKVTTSGPRYDCTGSWSSGCTADLP